jgi:hypothetical protein
VVSEASAIESSYAFADILDQPAQDKARQLIREYVAQRLRVSDLQEVSAAAIRSEQILDQLWSDAVVFARADPTPVMAQYLVTIDAIGGQRTARLNAEFANRIPPSIIFGLYVVAFLTMLLDGIYNSFGQRRNLAGLFIVVLILSIVLILIIDLDRTQQGLIKISQKALLDLQLRLNAAP